MSKITIKVMAFAIAAGFGFAGVGAKAQSLCETYIVSSGDTLSTIAKRANVRGGYQAIFSANSDVLSNPNLIEVGIVLRIPCADGSLPVTNAPAVTAAATETAVATPSAPSPTQIRFLTGGNYAPFTGEDLPDQGMFSALVKRAIELASPDTEARITFVNDWGSHLTDLLPSGAFDMGFPWFLPDCTRLDRLSPSNAMRCTQYDATDPFFEAVVGFYTKAGSPYAGATQHSDLFGARLCRPDGWFTFDLEAEALVEPNISMSVPASQMACWEEMMNGDVDVVTFEVLPAEADLEALGVGDEIVDIPALSTLATLHVFVPKSNPQGQHYIDILNAGLKDMRLSGEWFEIVSRHLAGS